MCDGVVKVNKVPLLGDIPVVGWLFKNQSKDVNKVNLLFFLTPKILSSYEKTVSAKVKDLLNRRSKHLKEVLGEDDPFGTTVKGLYEKAKKQEQGPLYDVEDAEKYKKQNEFNEGIKGIEDELGQKSPNYEVIIQNLKQMKSATRPFKVIKK